MPIMKDTGMWITSHMKWYAQTERYIVNVHLTICEATRGSYCIERAMFVSGPRASMEISPGWAITVSAINLAAGVSTATPCAKQVLV